MLTIVIPTYNRLDELKILLSSIVSSDSYINDKIKVIVSDNCSTDGSIEYLNDLGRKEKNIKVNFNDENIGFARNINKLVELSDTKYVWLMGSDEVVTSNSMDIVLSHLDNDCDIYVGDCIYQSGGYRKLYSYNHDEIVHIHNSMSYCDFLSNCREVSSIFAFISTLIVKKEFWESIELNDYEFNHAYTHMLRINKIISKQDARVCYINYPLVHTGIASNEFNDNKLKHLELDLDTFKYISVNYFSNDEKIKLAYRKFFFNYRNFLIYKNNPNGYDWTKLYGYFSFFNIPEIVYKKNKLDFILYKTLQKTYRVFKK